MEKASGRRPARGRDERRREPGLRCCFRLSLTDGHAENGARIDIGAMANFKTFGLACVSNESFFTAFGSEQVVPTIGKPLLSHLRRDRVGTIGQRIDFGE